MRFLPKVLGEIPRCMCPKAPLSMKLEDDRDDWDHICWHLQKIWTKSGKRLKRRCCEKVRTCGFLQARVTGCPFVSLQLTDGVYGNCHFWRSETEKCLGHPEELVLWYLHQASKSNAFNPQTTNKGEAELLQSFEATGEGGPGVAGHKAAVLQIHFLPQVQKVHRSWRQYLVQLLADTRKPGP